VHDRGDKSATLYNVLYIEQFTTVGRKRNSRSVSCRLQTEVHSALCTLQEKRQIRGKWKRGVRLKRTSPDRSRLGPRKTGRVLSPCRTSRKAAMPKERQNRETDDPTSSVPSKASGPACGRAASVPHRASGQEKHRQSGTP
jgi:hypothetical protein